MKFTDGRWLMREGVQAFYPFQAYDVEAAPGALTIYAPTRPIRDRGDTLKGPLLTVECSSPLADVIRVRLTHFAGRPSPGPRFELEQQEAPQVSIDMDDTAATLTSGQLTVRVPRQTAWQLDFMAGERLLTSSGPKGMGMVELQGQGHFMHEQLGLGVGEYVYGLGERFSALIKNGQVVEIWNKDGGTGSEQAYKSIPFYLTNRGYGVFVNHPEHVSFEVASEKLSCVQFSVAGHELEYLVIYGPTPREVLEKYTALTGRPALPPPWSFGLWLTTSFTTSYDEATVTSFIQGMADRELPLHVFHFDCFWMREMHWCDFQWDQRVFPDPPAMLARLKERGLRICLWINPYIAQRSPLFAEGAREGYLLKRPDGSVWQTDLWQPGMAIVDFTNPGACRWFAGKLQTLLEMGVDCFKTDFGERIPTDVVYFDGSDPLKMHNYYPQLYNQTVFELLRQQRGEGEAVVFARSATAGGQRFPVHWGGDCDASFESMAESLRGGLSLGMSGFGFWSHDIGGFEGTPAPEVYKRWIAFGLLSSHSRLHGSQSYRVPWLFDEESVDVLRLFTRLKCRVMPYLYSQALVARDTGLPVMRAMLLEFPDDPTCAFLDRQYMLGEALLVAPVFSLDGVVDYYVPAGRWTSLLSGEVVQGPGWVREQHPVTSLPLLARPNSLIAFGQEEGRPDYDYADGVTLSLYQLDDGHAASAIIPAQDGVPAARFKARREGQTIVVERQAGGQTSGERQSSGGKRNPGGTSLAEAKPWRVLLAGIQTVSSAGGTHHASPLGLLITMEPGEHRLEIKL